LDTRDGEESAPTTTAGGATAPGAGQNEGGGPAADLDAETRAATSCAVPAGTVYTADLAGRAVVVIVDATSVVIRDAQDCSTVATFAR
jgi:hypothetical protein